MLSTPRTTEKMAKLSEAETKRTAKNEGINTEFAEGTEK